MQKNLQSFKNIMSFVFLSAFCISAQAALVIDDFTDIQIVRDNQGSGATTDSPFSISGSDLGVGVQRTSSSEVFGTDPFAESSIKIGGGKLAISNDASSTGGSASLFWDGFATNDFTAAGTAILLKVISIDLGVTVEMIINGIASSGSQGFSGPGDFFVLFSDFTSSSEFTAVNSVELVFSGVNPWDGQFSLLVADIPKTVPEPSVLILMLLGFSLVSYMKASRT